MAPPNHRPKLSHVDQAKHYAKLNNLIRMGISYKHHKSSEVKISIEGEDQYVKPWYYQLQDIKNLLKTGVNVLPIDSKVQPYSTQSQTPLHLAIRAHNPIVLDVLLEKVTEYDENLFISLHKLNLNNSPSDKRSEITSILNKRETDLKGSKIAKVQAIAIAIAIAEVEFEVDVEFETNLHAAIRTGDFEVLTDLLEETIQYDERLFVSLHKLNLKFNTKVSSDKSLTAIGNKITAVLNKRENELADSQKSETKAKLYSAIQDDDPKVLASLLEKITTYDESLFISLHELNLKLGIKASSDKSFTAIGNKITAVLKKRENELTDSKRFEAEAKAKITAQLYSAIHTGNSEVLANLLTRVTTHDENLFKSLYRLSINAPADTKDEIIAILIRAEAELPDSPKYIESQARDLPLPNSRDSQKEEKTERDGKKSDMVKNISDSERKVEIQSDLQTDGRKSQARPLSLNPMGSQKEEKIEKEGKKSDTLKNVTCDERKVEIRSDSKNKNEFPLRSLKALHEKTSSEIENSKSFLNNIKSLKNTQLKSINRLNFLGKMKEALNYYIGYRLGFNSLHREIEKCDISIAECEAFLSRKEGQIKRIDKKLQRLEKDVLPTDIVSRKQEQQDIGRSKSLTRKRNESNGNVFQKIISGIKDWKHLDKASQQSIQILVQEALEAAHCQNPSEQVILKIREKITNALYDKWNRLKDDVQEKRKGVYIKSTKNIEYIESISSRFFGLLSLGETLTFPKLVELIEAGEPKASPQTHSSHSISP